MLREMFQAKIHHATVTECRLGYQGSLTVDIELIDHVIILSERSDKIIYAECRIIPSWWRRRVRCRVKTARPPGWKLGIIIGPPGTIAAGRTAAGRVCVAERWAAQAAPCTRVSF